MNFAVEPANVLSFLSKGILYSRPHDVFLRELIQNSLDSITQRRALLAEPEFAGRIDIRYDAETLSQPATLTIADNGFGMSRTSVEQDLLRPMTPHAHRARARNPRLESVQNEFIGRYGLGLMTVFHIADGIVIKTLCPMDGTGHRVAINLVREMSVLI